MLQKLARLIALAKSMRRGRMFANGYRAIDDHQTQAVTIPGDLESYFDGNRDGPGIWKWRHYFPIYERHLAKFVGREVHVAEVGIYSGGSLPMWRKYFGDRCHVYGIDIEDACRQYESEGVQVFIGDQADRQFWRGFREKVPRVDMLIDDGGHKPEQQIVTLEETLPHLARGGVYLCEDIHGFDNLFGAYVGGLQQGMHYRHNLPGPVLASAPSSLQRDIGSIHVYPFCVVIEKAGSPVERLVAPKHGTQWQPFL